MPVIQTPFYLIDKAKLLRNMEIIDRLREGSGAKALLALKCFATWSAFDLMRGHMDGTTSSSLFELRLAYARRRSNLERGCPSKLAKQAK